MRSGICFTTALLVVFVRCGAPRLMYTGRVVDIRGRPVPHAGLLISSMDENAVGIIQGWDADADGMFTFTFPERVRHISAWSPDSKRKGDLDSPPVRDSVIVIQ